MLNHNGYAAYANSKIMTASPAELTLMLYDGAIKFCNIAIAGIEENNIEKAHNNIRKVENIISEFQSTLNHKYAIADDFNNVYVYLKERLIKSLRRKKEVLSDVLKLSEEQSLLLDDPNLETDTFEKNVNRKAALIDKLEQLDTGFESLYEKSKRRTGE